MRLSTGNNHPCPNCRICGPHPCARSPVPPFPVYRPHRALGCALLSRPPARSPVCTYTLPINTSMLLPLSTYLHNATLIPLDDLPLSLHQAIPDARLQDAIQPSLHPLDTIKLSPVPGLRVAYPANLCSSNHAPHKPSPTPTAAAPHQPSRMRSLSELFVLGAGHPGCHPGDWP